MDTISNHTQWSLRRNHLGLKWIRILAVVLFVIFKLWWRLFISPFENVYKIKKREIKLNSFMFGAFDVCYKNFSWWHFYFFLSLFGLKLRKSFSVECFDDALCDWSWATAFRLQRPRGKHKKEALTIRGKVLCVYVELNCILRTYELWRASLMILGASIFHELCFVWNWGKFWKNWVKKQVYVRNFTVF